MASLIILLFVVPLMIVGTTGLMQLFLLPLFVEFKARPPAATQFFLSDGLLFLLTFGGLSSVLFAVVDERDVLMFLMFLLLVLLGLMWAMGCHLLSRLNVKDFWPRAVGLTCISAAMAASIALSLTFLPVLLVLPRSIVPLLVWMGGFPLALVLCRLGAAYTLRQALGV